jgi:signal transduction histidine kinase
MMHRVRAFFASSTFPLIGIVASILVVGIASQLARNQNQENLIAWYNTRIDLQRTFVAIVDEETGMRGYIATRDRIFLQPYSEAAGRLDGYFALLAAESAGDTNLVAQVAVIRGLHGRWLVTVAAPLIANPSRRNAHVIQLQGKIMLDAIRAASHEYRLGIDAHVADALGRTRLINVTALVSIMTLVCLFWAAGRASERGRQAAEATLLAELARRNAALERSNRLLEEFAYIASHDLQEPLRTISSFTELLQKRYAGKFDAEADGFIAQTVEGARRMRQLINDVLEYSRVTTHGRPFVPVDLSAVADRALADLRGAIAERSAHVRVGAMPEVLGDRTQLTQLLANLIGNALKYSRREHPRIEIEARAEGDMELISVRDDGIGVAPEDHERIFGIFSRLHTRTEFPGTGIGLALCRRIVERHGGRIWVDSAEGEGAMFSFTLRPAAGGAAL